MIFFKKKKIYPVTKFEKSLPKRFFQWIEFELGPNPKNNKTLLNSKLRFDFSDVIFGKNISSRKTLSPIANLLAFYNKNVFKLNYDTSDISNLEFFLNDINVLDDFILNSHLNFKDYHLPIDRPLLSSVFHFDNHPFYETYMEPEFLFTALYSDNLLSAKFPSTLEKPFGMFLTSKHRQQMRNNKIKNVSLQTYFNSYYLTRTFLTLLMDEERLYVSSRIVLKYFFRFLFVVLLILIIIHHITPIIFFVINKFTWKFFYCSSSEFYRKCKLFINDPIKTIKFWSWNAYLTLKLGFIYIHDFSIAIYYIKHPRKASWYWIIDERNKIKKRDKYSQMFYRWFW